MKKYRILYIICLLLIISCAKDIIDLTSSIEGIVKDNVTSEPLQGVSITLSPSGKSATTGNDGRYSFPELDAGNYSIEFSKVGYEANKKEVTVLAGKPMQVDAMLNKITNALIINPTTLNFGDLETSKTLFVSCLEQLGDIRYTIKVDADWISLSKSDGNATSAGDKITITIDRSKLSIGNYEKNITITSSYGEVVIPVIVNQVERDIATLTTNAPENITETSLTIKGTIVKTGGLKITSHGHCWSETEQPTINNNKNNLGDTESIGDFTSTLTNLVAGKSYFIRAYAINSKGVAYSEQVSVTMPFIEKPTVSTLAISSLTKDSVILNGEVKDNGNGNIKEYGFYWGLTDNTEHKVKISTIDETKFSYTLKSLESKATYYYKAYAINEKGESTGEIKTFTSLDKDAIEGVATVITNDATDITINSAILNGVIKNSGDSKIVQRGFYFGTSESSMTKKTVNTTDSIISLHVTDLADGTTYCYKAFAVNSKGESCGSTNTFTTLEGMMPVVVTNEATDVSYEQAVLNGTITTLGDYEILECGFYYGTDENSMTKIVGSRNDNTISVTADNLSTNTVYYYKTYVATKKGEVYGDIVVFSTLDESVVLPWDGTIESSFAGGSGTRVSPYIIRTGGQLLLIKQIDSQGLYFELANNIDLNNMNWLPISFDGNLNGNGYTIHNLKIECDDKIYIGLFEKNSGKISNLNIHNVDIITNNSNDNYTGVVTGYNYGTIENCNVVFERTSKLQGTNFVGGLSGRNNGDIKDCSVISNDGSFSIKGYNVGGCIGISESSNEGNVYVERCKVNCNLFGDLYVGGIVGHTNHYGKIYITQSEYNGKIEGLKYVGGIVGRNDDGLNITASKSDVVMFSEYYAGGIVGFDNYVTKVTACYSTGTIESGKYKNDIGNEETFYSTGGFIIYFSYSTITDVNTIATYNVSKYDNISTKMKNEYSEYAEYWDFNNNWTWKGVVDGVSKSVVCPRLSWE